MECCRAELTLRIEGTSLIFSDRHAYLLYYFERQSSDNVERGSRAVGMHSTIGKFEDAVHIYYEVISSRPNFILKKS